MQYKRNELEQQQEKDHNESRQAFLDGFGVAAEDEVSLSVAAFYLGLYGFDYFYAIELVADKLKSILKTPDFADSSDKLAYKDAMCQLWYDLVEPSLKAGVPVFKNPITKNKPIKE